MFTRKGMQRFAQGDHSKQETDAPRFAGESPQSESAPGTAAAARAELDAKRFPPPPLPDTTSIGKNFNLEGDNIVIRCKGSLTINGAVGADIHCEHLSIGETARITGAIAADEVSVHGHVEGTINGAQVTLHSSANVEADINSQFLSIERGAQFDGRSRRVSDVAEIAPQLMSSANDAHEHDGTTEHLTNATNPHTNLDHVTELEPSHQDPVASAAEHIVGAHTTNGTDQELAAEEAQDITINYPSNGTSSG